MENKKHWLRSFLMYTLVTAVVVAGGVLFFQEPTIAQQTGAAASSSRGIGLTIARVVQVILGVALVASLGFLVYGAFLISSAEGEELQEGRGKRIVRVSAIVLAALAILFGLVTFVASRLQRGGNVLRPTPSGPQIGSGLGGFPVSLLETHFPENGQRNLSRNTSIMVTFTEAMDVSTLINNGGTPGDTSDDLMNTNNIRLLRSDDDLSAGPFVAARAQVTEDLRTFLFTPIDLLGSSQENTLYTAVIGEGVASENGLNSFTELGEYTWEFEVGTFIDLQPPQVVSVIPEQGSTHPRNIIVQVTFNEAMNPLTVTGSVGRGFDNIAIRDASGELVNGRFSISNQYRTVEFITDDFCGVNACGEDVFCLPGREAFSGELRAATVSIQPPAALFPFDGITDAANNSLDGNLDGSAQGNPDDNYFWNFQTTDQIDLTPPVITNVTPGPFSTNVSLSSPIRAEFSKPLQFSSLTRQSVRVEGLSSVQISADTRDRKSTISIQHEGLQEDTTYSPVFSSDLRDLYQNCYRPCVGP